jgi:hypothetical protein
MAHSSCETFYPDCDKRASIHSCGERMKVLVCGGRYYSNHLNVFNVLDELKPTCVVNGGAQGADYLARYWAQERNIECITVEANWELHGRAAGPLRNTQMLIDNPDIKLVVAFSGGKRCGEYD